MEDQLEITAVEIVELLRYPEARQAAVNAGWTQGVEFDVRNVAAGMAEHGYFVTSDLAWDVGRRHGHNLRCNRCGTFGAIWISEQRPGWGSLALCPPHEQELAAEHKRHQAALARLRKVNFEQPPPVIRRGRHAVEW
jgi:hypothetical protein